MPRRKKSERTIKSANLKETQTPQKEKFLPSTKHLKNISQQLRLDESYVSLVLGAVVVLVVSVLFFLFLKGNELSATKEISPTPSITSGQTKNKEYILQEGESLWDVAVKFYGDGYRYTEIIEANNFENPDYVPPGTRLIIPNVK